MQLQMHAATVVLMMVAVAALQASASSMQKVKSLPGGSHINDTMYTGFVTIDETFEGSMFFWFAESRSEPSKDPVVLWLTGGPGCSSDLALVTENGMFKVKSASPPELEPNPYSWNEVANMIWVDNPVGVGFSPPSVDIAPNEDVESLYLLNFIKGWFDLFPAFKGREFFIFGESFAGHYAPALAARIVTTTGTGINFKGVAMGDPWTDPLPQYQSYVPFGKANKLVSGLGEIAADAATLACTELYHKAAAAPSIEAWVEAEDACSVIMEIVLKDAPKIDGKQINVYDIKAPCEVPGLCYNFTVETEYMNLPALQAALGVPPTKWEPCSTLAGLPFIIDRVLSMAPDVATVLAANVPVYVYSGTYDLICNHLGADMWLSQLGFADQAAFNALSLQPWSIDGSVVGAAKSAGGLTQINVDAASHLVPMSKPVPALHLLINVLHGTPFTNNAPRDPAA